MFQLQNYKSILTISHNDLDGVTSAFVTFNKIKNNNLNINIHNVFYSYGNNIIDLLNTEFNKKQFDCVIITDISISSKEIEQFADFIYNNPLVQFVWIDHHENSCYWSNSNLITILKPHNKKCAAELIHEFYYNDNNLFDENYLLLLKYTHDIDFWEKQYPEADDISLLIHYLGANKIYNLLKYDLNFINNYKNINSIKNKLNEAKQERYNSLELALSTINELKEHNIVTAICSNYTSYVAHEILKKYPQYEIIALMSINKSLKPYISFRRKNGSDVNLSELAKKFNGGGHPYAAGAKVNPKLFYNNLINWFNNYIKSNIN